MKTITEFLTATLVKLGFVKIHGFATEAEWNEHEEEAQEQGIYDEEDYPLFV
ncbi:hypothetical protein E0W68_12035 [Flavobacterium salilacus subsp. salilacus]|uniref:hypothetical protein n=1 Tax=Flavobacterium TaxID=237 RepID=UPI001389EB53|nr:MULTISPECIES: hypothetical protein [Flavobacterium]KAF2516256.1 hypothetical protein E0W68_12035 [Flavobacterium salilacus subsp. salilacus]MBE1613784.1 hypothetical protein [Flavobacterium sp. SaA2.13]NDI99968.1 hypothetical protein [Flavobacterium salilacus subsp. altitudinum]